MKELLSKNIKPLFFLLSALVGVLLICFSGNGAGKKDNEGNNINATELDLYAATLENKLAQIVECMEGAGETKVMITFESSFEKIFASNAKVEENGNMSGGTGKTSEKQIVLAGSGTAGEQPVLLKEMCPRVKGVVVVCNGAGNKELERKIKDAATALFGINDFDICVTKSGK